MGEQGIPSRPGDPAGEDAGGAVRQEERRRVLPVLATALSVLAVVLLLPARGESSSLSAKSAAEERGKMAVKRSVPGKGVMPGLKAATDKGLVQPLSDIRHAAAEENVRAAAGHPVAGHMLEQVEKKEEKPVGLPDKNPDKILVKMYMESKCPACRKFSTTYVKQILESDVGDVVDFEYAAWGWGVIEEEPSERQLELNPKADFSDNVLNHTTQLTPVLRQLQHPPKASGPGEVPPPLPELLFQCQHGFEECEGNAWEACLQDVAPRHQDFFPVFDCVEARSCPEGVEPPECVGTPAAVMQGCLEEYGAHVNSPELLRCYHGKRMRELLVMNDIATLEAKPQWVPWFTIDGVDLVQDPDNENTTVSFREQFLLGKKICDAYVAKTGKDAPQACTTFPQNDEEVGSDPWARFKKFNFTALIAEQRTQLLRKEAARRAILEEQNSPWAFFKVKTLVVVICLFVAAGGSAWYCTQQRKKVEYQTLDKEEHV